MIILLFLLYATNLFSSDCERPISIANKFVYVKPIKTFEDLEIYLKEFYSFLDQNNASNEKEFSKSFAVMESSRENKLPFLQILVKLGADINSLFSPEPSDKIYITPLAISILAGSLETTKFLIDKEAKLNNLCGDTPFTIAIKYNKLRILQMLRYYDHTEINIDKSVANFEELLSPEFNFDYPKDRIEFAYNHFLDELPEDPCTKLKSATLYQLYLFGDAEIAKKLLTCSTEQNQQIEEVKQLFRAVTKGSKVNGNMTIVKNLAKYIPLGLVDKNYDTLMDIAIKNKDKSMIATLLLQNDDTREILAQTNWQGTNPIQRAMLSGHEDMVKFICIFYKKPVQNFLLENLL